MTTEYFKGKKITVMRIGLLGRGIGDTAYLAESGAEVTVVDAASEEVMRPAVEALKQYETITWKFGPYDFADFENADMVLVGAGTPLDESVLQKCRDKNIRLTQSAVLFAQISKIPIIGVTGTRGKSTVTHLIHHVLTQVTGEEVLLGGNIRGVSNLQLLKQVSEDSLCVMELDSWQLQAWGWAGRSPEIAVFTNFMPDHLNYYQQSGMSTEEALRAYFADKANIFAYQDESGTLVTTPEVLEQVKVYSGGLGITLGQEIVLVDDSLIPQDSLLSLPGRHNRLNTALAIEALKTLSLTEEEIFTALSSFKGVEGRLQYCGTVQSAAVYNDNNATTPTATLAGITALKESGVESLVLILGGADKMLSPAVLVQAMKKECGHIILLPGTGTEILKQEMRVSNYSEDFYTEVENIEQALSIALEKVESGGVVLFSPGYASFGLFKNEYERNDAFMKVFYSLQDKEV